MTISELRKGIIVCHRNYNRYYQIESAKCRFKNLDGQWVDGVTYKPLYNDEVELFIREVGSFLEEFDVPSYEDFGPYKNREELEAAYNLHNGEVRERQRPNVTADIVSPPIRDHVRVCGGSLLLLSKAISFNDLFAQYIWIDGTPCGVKRIN